MEGIDTEIIYKHKLYAWYDGMIKQLNANADAL